MIKSLSLHKFKCFDKLENIEFSQINLLTGLNGRGKSTMIQSMLLVAQSFSENKSLENLKINDGKFLRLGTFKDVLNVRYPNDDFGLQFETDDLTEKKIELICHSVDGKPTLASFRHLCVDGSELVEIMTENVRGATEQKEIVGVTSSVSGLKQFQNFYYVMADRRGPVNRVERDDSLGINEIGNQGEHLINILALRKKELLSQLQGYLSRILKGAYIDVQDESNTLIGLYLDSADESNGFMPINVGFGYSYILPVLLTLLVAEENAKVVIENPEAHLHPGAVSRLMEVIVELAKKKNLQLFIETHSDHVINGLRIAVKHHACLQDDARILHFYRNSLKGESPKVTQILIDKEGNLSDYPADFMEEWTNQMAELV